MSLIEIAQQFKNSVNQGNLTNAEKLLQNLKGKLLELDSLPPLSLPSPNSQEEIYLARDIYEHAVILSVKQEDQQNFQIYLSMLRPYRYGLSPPLAVSPLGSIITGLHLLFLLIENQLADFHSELELLNEEQRNDPAIIYCTKLDQDLMIGSYDNVIQAALHPPIEYFSFFLTSLRETVRINIWECVLSSYRKLTLSAATNMLMFSTIQETKDFLQEKYPDSVISNDVIELASHKHVKSEEELKSHRLIEQTLSYAAELERIV